MNITSKTLTEKLSTRYNELLATTEDSRTPEQVQQLLSLSNAVDMIHTYNKGQSDCSWSVIVKHAQTLLTESATK